MKRNGGGCVYRIKIPRAFAHYDVLPENAQSHPDTSMRYDIPNRVIYVNLAANENANVVRVRFTDRLDFGWSRT